MKSKAWSGIAVDGDYSIRWLYRRSVRLCKILMLDHEKVLTEKAKQNEDKS